MMMMTTMMTRMMITYSSPFSFSLYYVCVFGGPLLESCTGGLVYRYIYVGPVTSKQKSRAEISHGDGAMWGGVVQNHVMENSSEFQF